MVKNKETYHLSISELIDFLTKRDLANAETIDIIEKHLEQYPFDQFAMIILLKIMSKIDHPRFESKLRQLAIAIPDRARLYQIINSEQFFNQLIATINGDVLYAESDQKDDLNDLILHETIQQPAILFNDDNKINDDPSALVAQINKNAELAKQKKSAQKSNNESPDVKKDNYQTKHNNDENIEDSFDFVTETLADIYIHQKLYDKAIHIFEKLCLKFPEKSAYFANRIESVEETKLNRNPEK